MATGGYAAPGHDPTLPTEALPEVISSALLWPLGLHGYLGLSEEGELKPSESAIEKSRRWRNERLDRESAFFKTFSDDPAVQRWLKHRNELMPQFEQNELINHLNLRLSDYASERLWPQDLRGHLAD